jgi:polar amino acid transport system substrate-binding protein
MNILARFTFGSLAFLLAAAGASPPANAVDTGVAGMSFSGGDGSFKRVVDSGITLGIAADPPYTYRDEQTNEFDGIDVSIFREVCKRLGITDVKWELVQFDALVPGLVSKRWDVVVDNLHENPKRLAVISFTSPAYWYGTGLAVSKGNPKNIHKIEDLAGHNVGAVRGSSAHAALEKRTDLKELKLYTSNEGEFADLIAGRIDAVLDDDIKIGQFIKHNPDVPIEFASGYDVSPDEFGYARYGIAKEDVDLNHAVSRAIEEMRGDQTISKILASFGLTDRNLWYYSVK